MKKGLTTAFALASALGWGALGFGALGFAGREATACEPTVYHAPQAALTARPVGYGPTSYHGATYGTPIVTGRYVHGGPPYSAPVYGQPLYQRPIYPVAQTYGRPVYQVSPHAVARPVSAYRPIAPIGTTPANSYVGPGILGQPKAYVPGQPLRNFARYLLP